MNRYNSIEEAFTGLATRLAVLKEIFCPLTNTSCNFKCVCFRQPCIYEKTFNVFQGGCDNKMFKGSDESRSLLGPL